MHPNDRKRWISLALLAFVFLLKEPACGAPGDLDPSFNAEVTNYPTVNSLAVQPDGKIVAGGNFTIADGPSMYYIARFNPDGSLDPAFNPAYIDGPLQCVLLQTNGNILIGGTFKHVGGAVRYNIARLDATGALDTSFNPGTNVNGTVYSIAFQPAGKFAVAGGAKGAARLNSDGSIDNSFNIGSGTYGMVNCIASQQDGKVLIGGSFSLVNGVASDYLARLNTDGSLDGSYNPNIPLGGAGSGVLTMWLQPDGKLIVGGRFSANFNGTNVNNLVRLNTDGSFDASFNLGSGPNGTVYAVAPETDGQLIVSGYFAMIGNLVQENIARLNMDGSVDQKFQTLSAWWGTIEERPIALASQADNKVIIGGVFGMVDGFTHSGIARLFGDYPPALVSLAPLTNGNCVLSGVAATNAHLQLDSSTNLTTWLPVSEFTNINGAFTATDPQTNNYSRKFYRAVWLP